MGTNMKECSGMENDTNKAPIPFFSLEKSTRADGSMTSDLDMVKQPRRMVESMRESINMISTMDTES